MLKNEVFFSFIKFITIYLILLVMLNKMLLIYFRTKKATCNILIIRCLLNLIYSTLITENFKNPNRPHPYREELLFQFPY